MVGIVVAMVVGLDDEFLERQSPLPGPGNLLHALQAPGHGGAKEQRLTNRSRPAIRIRIPIVVRIRIRIRIPIPAPIAVQQEFRHVLFKARMRRQQPIGLVQHQEAHVREPGRARSPEQLGQPPGRGHHKVRLAVLQNRRLLGGVHPADHQRRFDIVGAPQRQDLLMDLLGELPGGAHDDGVNAVRVQGQLVQNGQDKGGGLAASGRGQGQDVGRGIAEQKGDNLSLDGRGLLKAEGPAGVDEGFGEAQVSKGGPRGEQGSGVESDLVVDLVVDFIVELQLWWFFFFFGLRIGMARSSVCFRQIDSLVGGRGHLLLLSFQQLQFRIALSATGVVCPVLLSKQRRHSSFRSVLFSGYRTR
mmetsp:Transcript_24497/g.57904  ORF Transcript_24497/g.57904 Transcript_24497/m.57904 type:complete len:359 (-) Transcript_24497:187-1263(-)